MIPFAIYHLKIFFFCQVPQIQQPQISLAPKNAVSTQVAFLRVRPSFASLGLSSGRWPGGWPASGRLVPWQMVFSDG